MKTQTTVNVKTTLVRMFNPKTDELVNYKTNSLLTTPEAREIAKARNLTFIDKQDITVSFPVSNDTLLTFNKPKD